MVYEPQMVVVHIGTNDMFDNGQASTAGEDLQQLIDKITIQLPNTQIVVSSIVTLPINNFERNSYVLNYNALIPGIVDSFRDQGKLVTYVDMYHALDINDFSPDMIHPSSEGYDKMAVVWYDAIQAILTSSEKDPMKPGNVQLVSNDGSSSTFSWSASSDNVGVTAYDIYQDGVWFATTINTQFTVTNLPANSTLSYTVVAKDAAGNLSLPSDEVVVSTATTLINLVQNQGFETGSLSPWSIWGGGNGTIVSDSPHDGLYELRISPQSGGQQDLVGYGLNESYIIGVWGRVSVAGQSAKVVIIGSGIDQMIEFTNTSYEYKTIQFTSPSYALSWLAVQLWNGSAADFYIDDVQVYLVE